MIGCEELLQYVAERTHNQERRTCDFELEHTSTGSTTSTTIPAIIVLPKTSRFTSGVPSTVRYDFSSNLRTSQSQETTAGGGKSILASQPQYENLKMSDVGHARGATHNAWSFFYKAGDVIKTLLNGYFFSPALRRVKGFFPPQNSKDVLQPHTTRKTSRSRPGVLTRQLTSERRRRS